MGFADAYLLKAGLRGKLIRTEPHPGVRIIVTIPVYNESGLERCLDSLFLCHVPPGMRAEVLILINAPAGAPRAVLEQNRLTHRSLPEWIGRHPHPSIDFHPWLDHSFGSREAGVGLARKILMDEAVRRFSAIETAHGIIASLDADAVVESNYLEAIFYHFEGTDPNAANSKNPAPKPDGCSLYFEHPLAASEDPLAASEDPTSAAEDPLAASEDPTSAAEDPTCSDGVSHAPVVYESIIQYELHLRYYLQSIRSTGYPYGFHTVGSSFAVRADVYCKEGGMNRRRGGEDFYFIQKVAQRGNFSECNTTCVRPSPRPSNRVPFGTGRAIQKLVEQNSAFNGSSGSIGNLPVSLTTYHPEPFIMLRHLFSGLDSLWSEVSAGQFIQSLPQLVQGFLEEQDFVTALQELRQNSTSLPSFRKRFWRWFNMFRIMKFLHFARERGCPDIPVGEASCNLLLRLKPEVIELPSDGASLRELLMKYRQLDRSGSAELFLL